MRFVLLGLLLCGINANAYVRTVAETGSPLFWPNPNIALYLNPTNSSGLAQGQVSTMISGAFDAWTNAGSAANYSMNSSTSNSTSSQQDNTSRVFFTSNSSSKLDYGVIAVTQVYYYTGNGQIVESDMIFNDTYFQFTATPGDTGISNRIYLQDVATHEAGHAYGLDHSTANRSSLVYRAFSGQFTLGEDDKAAIKTLYSGGVSGAISGKVLGTKSGMFGAHVLAINTDTGKVQSAILADESGNFRLNSLPAGNYVIETEPFYPSTATISNFYKNVDHRFCSGSKFKRTFYGACGNAGVASTVTVGSGDVNIGSISPSCSSMGNPGGSPTSIATARSVSTNGGAYYATLGSNSVHYYKISNFSGDLKVRAMTWSLFSAMDPTVEILSSSGNSVGASGAANVDNPLPGGKINYDSSAQVTGLSTNDYIIRVTSGSSFVSSYAFPAGNEYVDAQGFYLLLVSANGSQGTHSITDMSSCVSVNNVAQGATSSPAPKKPGEDGQEGACGTISMPQDGSGGPPFYSTSLFMILLAALGSRLIPVLARQRGKR
jgi:hypothetical protein